MKEDTKNSTRDCSGDRKGGGSNRLVKKNSRGRNKGRRGEKSIVRDRDRRTSEESFLKAEDLRGVRGNKMPEVLTVGTEAADVPLKNRHN